MPNWHDQLVAHDNKAYASSSSHLFIFLWTQFESMMIACDKTLEHELPYYEIHPLQKPV
jgi:hypothetical protein